MIRIADSDIGRAIVMLDKIPNGVSKAARSAINKTITGVRTDTKQEVTKRYEVKSSAVHKSITINRAKGSTLEAFAISQGRPIPLVNFKVRPKKVQRKGPRNKKISVSVKKGSATTLNNAFVAQFKSGHMGVVERKTRKRYPVRELFGPSIPKMMENKFVMGVVEDKAQVRLKKSFNHEIDRIMKGYGK